jgi:hypothetical protein
VAAVRYSVAARSRSPSVAVVRPWAWREKLADQVRLLCCFGAGVLVTSVFGSSARIGQPGVQ